MPSHCTKCHINCQSLYYQMWYYSTKKANVTKSATILHVYKIHESSSGGATVKVEIMPGNS